MPSIIVYARHAADLSRDEFIERYPDAVFLAEPTQALDDSKYETISGRGGVAGGVVVAPLRKNPASNTLKDTITIGRMSDNDVVFKVGGVSKVHAFVRYEEGVPYLIDADSKFGTFVGERKVKPRTERVPLKVGESVAFGKLRATYYTAGAFHEFLNKASEINRA